MTDLAAALQSLVDRPIARPTPVAEIGARGRAIRARRHRMGGGLAAAAVACVAIAGLVAVRDDSDAVSVALRGRDTTSAGYLATGTGGYEGRGTWRLTIIRDGETLTFTSETSPACGSIGTIQSGDRVVGEISGEHSLLRAGRGVDC